MTGPGGDDEVGTRDAVLARAAGEGSREALGALFRRYAEEVYRLAYRITGTRAEAEDTLQDVFVGLPRALRRYREQGRFLSWLRQVTARTAISRVRTRGRASFEPLEAGELAARASPYDAVDRIALAQTLAAMPEANRLVFLLKEVEGYSHAEIGDLLSIRTGASRARLHRAWRFLEHRLGPSSLGAHGSGGGV